MTVETDRRVNRPRISVGSIIGFGTLLGTTMVAIVGAAMWIGALDRTVTDVVARQDRADHDTAAFISEMRQTLSTISAQLTQVRVDVAGGPNAPSHHR